LNQEEFNECLDKALQGCKMIYEIQRRALIQKYFGDEQELKEES